MGDFKVVPISETGNETLMLKVEPLLYRFVWLSEHESGNGIEQFLLLRYEMAECLRIYFESGKGTSSFYLVNGENLVFSGEADKLTLRLKTMMSPAVFEIPDTDGLFISTLLKDVEVLIGNRKKLVGESMESALTELLGEDGFDQEATDMLINRDLEILSFEQSLSNGSEKGMPSLTDIYKILLKRVNAGLNPIVEKLLVNFEYVYSNEECNCGYGGCLFEILKSNQTHFFKGDYHRVKGGLDSDKVTDDILDLIFGLTPDELAVTKYLYRHFEDSTLLNLAFLIYDFDLYGYQRQVCFPYQPDDPDGHMVRSISTMASFFIRKDRMNFHRSEDPDPLYIIV